jgi:hypothetical protein
MGYFCKAIVQSVLLSGQKPVGMRSVEGLFTKAFDIPHSTAFVRDVMKVHGAS